MARKRTSEKGALELLEEAVHLLRLAPAQTLLCYGIGTLPFVLGFLFFWADMSRSAFAAQHVGRAAFALVLLFVWMKVWQTIFTEQLSAQITGRNPEEYTFSRMARIAFAQIIVQPSGFFVLPISALIVFPFGWVFAFYQNVLVLAGDRTKPLFKTSAKQAGLFPAQNHVGLLILGAFAFFVWLNIAMLLFMVPALLKMFLGFENAFTRSGIFAVLNTTFLATSFALTFLCIDPLAKSFYALRCFYGQSVTTGEDLKVELKSRARSVVLVTLALLFSLNSFAQSPATAIQNPPPPVSATKLDDSIERVLQQPVFTWRIPREKVPDDSTPKNWFVLFLESVGQTLMSWMRSIRDVIRDFVEWVSKFFRSKNPEPETSSSGSNWMTALQLSVFVLIALIASALALLFFRMWKQRKPKTVVRAEAVPFTPDLNDENVAATQLPEEGWLKLARELMEKGDLRLALRALYLASLAHLAQREYLSVAKFKSNREYDLELRRRARALPELQNAFTQNVTAFDRAWYGMHEVTLDILQGFQANLERIRAC